MPFPFSFWKPVASGYAATSAVFAGDGQCWMERDADLTGTADGTQFIFSVWIRPTGGDGVVQEILAANGSRVTVSRHSTNKIRVIVKNTANTVALQLDQDTAKFPAITSTSGWVHVLVTGKNTSVGGLAQLYINNTECATVTTNLANDTSYDFTDGTDWGVGALVGGTLPLTGEMAELYLNVSTSMDFTNSANRAKFISGGHPVDLGASGSTPTGASPLIYLKGSGTGFTANSGTGGNFVKKGTTAFTAGSAP